MNTAKKDFLKDLIGVVLLFSMLCGLLNYIYVPRESYEKVLFESYYEQDNIDNIFMGSSHVYCDIDPYLLDEINGQNNFNMSSPCQRWDDTYYLLKQANKENDLKHVYLECYYMDLAVNRVWDSKLGDYKNVDFMNDIANYAWPWRLTREMKYSINRFAILFNSSDKDHVMETIFPFLRYRGNLFDWNNISSTIINKRMMKDEKTFTRYGKDASGNSYKIETLPKGVERSSGRFLSDAEKKYKIKFDLSRQLLGPESEKYFRKTLAYCKQHNLPVTLFISPIYDVQLLSTTDYDNYVNSVKYIADEYGVELYDFNMIKDEYLDIKHGEYFNDMDHLNVEGSKLFTRTMWDIVNDDVDGHNGDMFYATYKEKLKNEQPEIYGLYYYEKDPREDELEEDGSPVYSSKVYFIATGMDDAKYRISRTVWDSDEVELVQDYDSSLTFELPAYQGGIVTIEAVRGNENYKIEVEY